ncbi:ATPase, F1/V1/A1 complex, alpha/beta subunit, partial [Tanacetum coccineum]
MFNSSTGLFSFQFSSMDGLDAMLENGPWFIRNNLLILKKWQQDENLLKEDVSTVPVWVKLHGVPVTAFSEDGLSAIATKLADVELKDNIVMAMPKITREGHYICNVRVEYELKPLSGNKKKGVEPTIEVSNSNPFDVLNSVNDNGEFGTNGGDNNLVNNEATSNESSFMNIDNYEECASNTPIGAKIDKIKRQISEGKLRLLDNDGNPLVPTGIVESDSEVELIFDET